MPTWGLARDTSEGERDNEAVMEKVNQMTKQAMASTADAWLDHLLGMARRNEVFMAEQIVQDSHAKTG